MKFDGPSWIKAGNRMNEIRETWEAETYAAAQAAPVVGDGTVPVDATVAHHTETLKLDWYNLIGNLGVALGSDSSRMKATGENYSATEEQAVEANNRFWGEE